MTTKNTRTMKKLLVIMAFTAALCLTEKAHAQLNINVGYAPELMTIKTPTSDTSFFYHGVCFGLNWTFDLSNSLSLTAGAQYRMNLRDESEHYWYGSIYNHYLTRERQTLIDIPILLKYNILKGNKLTVSPFAGPMLSWGIQGKTTETVTWPSNTELHHEWYGDNGYLNRFNVYATAGVEVGFKRFTFSVGGRYGFLDLNKRNTGTTIKTYGFFASFGHDF